MSDYISPQTQETYYESTNNQQDIDINNDPNEPEAEPEAEAEEGEEEEEDVQDLHHDLFGSDDDEANNNTDNKIISKEYKRSIPEGKKISISSNLSLSSLPQSSDFEFCMLRLPNVIGCETEEFDQDTYVEPSSTSSIENYIRWRTHFDQALAETFKESNTKLVYWKDGSKSLLIGKDCYDIVEHQLNGNRDFIYAKLDTFQNKNTSYKLCHGQFIKRLNVKATSQKSYETLQKNLAKKHERTKGSKQLTAAQRRNNRTSKQQQQTNMQNSGKRKKKKKVHKKRSLRQSYLEQGAHGNSSDDNEHMPKRKRQRHASDNSSSSSELSDDDESNYSESESDDDDEDDDRPIAARFD